MIINLSSDFSYCVIHAFWLYTTDSKRSTASLWIDRNYFFSAKPSYKNVWSSDTVIQLLSLEYKNLATSLPWTNVGLCCINSGFGLHLFVQPFLITGLKCLSSHYWLSQLMAEQTQAWPTADQIHLPSRAGLKPKPVLHHSWPSTSV